jgi:hypothetical protein
MEKIKTVHERMSFIKAELSKTKINKSGHNKYAGFKYHELNDFIEAVNRLNNENGINDSITIDKTNDECKLTLFNIEDSTDCYSVMIPYTDAEMLAKGGAASNVDAIQRLGSTVTYIRRYLYMTAYNIQESDGVDGNEQPIKEPQKAVIISDVKALEKLNESKTLEELTNAWIGLSQGEKNLQTVTAKKDELKTKLK